MLSTAPVFEVQGGPPTDAAVAALARLLLSLPVDEGDEVHSEDEESGQG
jgi:hypothetical protein